MKDPKILLNRIWIIFDVTCSLLALYMTLRNIGRFHEDTNATVITYKKYGRTVENQYPTLVYVLKEMAFIISTRVLYLLHTESI